MNRNLFLILFAFSFLYHLLNTLKGGILKVLGVQNTTLEWSELVFHTFVIEMIFALFLIIFLMFISSKILQKTYSWYMSMIVHLILYFVTLVAIYIIYDILFPPAGVSPEDKTLKYHLTSITFYLNVHFLLYFSNVFIIYTYHYLVKVSKVELNRSNLREQLVKVKVNILKYKLHPHFFFNTLNTITNLITTDSKLAQKTLVDFSGLLRDILYLKDSNKLKLSEELVILNKYLDILSVRFSDDLRIELEVEEGLDDALIPSLILQPIIENSIKHGYSYDHTNLGIYINIKAVKGNLVCRISNDGKPLDVNTAVFGTGLQNTKERLLTLYDTESVLRLENNPNGNGVYTELVFPLEFDDSDTKKAMD